MFVSGKKGLCVVWGGGGAIVSVSMKEISMGKYQECLFSFRIVGDNEIP